MKICNISIYLLLYLLMTVLFQNSQADVCQSCLCSTKEDTTISIDCHKAKFASFNILRFGLISVEYNQTLSVLDLSENNITYLPADMFESSSRLKILNLSNNLLQEITRSLLKNLNNLEILNLSNNKIKVFDSANLPALLILDLSNNKIEDIDLEFHKAYPLLSDLKLSHNNLDDSVNGTLTLLRNLKSLDLSYNKFHLLDNEDLNFLTQLISLNLSHNAIKSLSMQTFPDSLLELNVGFNSIAIFPTNLSNIEILNVEHNQLSKIKNITDELKKLKYLNISGNALEILPDLKLIHLNTLDLSYNNFKSIPETLSKENYPILDTLVFNGNFIKIIEFPSYLNIKSLIMQKMDNVEEINENSFKKLNYREDYCLNLTLTDNNQLRFIHENALEGLNICFLDLKNNKLTHLAPKLFNSGFKANVGVDLEGNPFHCNCSLQWMLDDFIPWLYSTNPNLLNNLRCVTPENLKGIRMVHWYKWKEQVWCDRTELYSSKMSAETLKVLSRSNPITLRTSNGMLAVLVITVIILLVLVIVGIVFAKRIALKHTRKNRRF